MKRLFVVVFITLLFVPPAFAQQRPHILLTNDDGTDHAGIKAVYNALVKVGKVTVAAPADNQSQVGHGYTTGRIPIFVDTRVDEIGNTWHKIAARPASCVRLALANLMTEKPDIVVSGANYGANLGIVAYLSGTVSAAREAAFDGIPAVAVSVEIGRTMDYDGAAEFTASLVRKYLNEKLPAKTLINIAYPARARDQILGVRVAPMSVASLDNYFEEGKGLSGERLFWQMYRALKQGEAGTDVEVMLSGYIAVTPMQLDHTAHPLLPKLRDWKLEELLPARK